MPNGRTGYQVGPLGQVFARAEDAKAAAARRLERDRRYDAMAEEAAQQASYESGFVGC
jgi:hypothetical protein